MKVILFIGHHKTGSTALQEFLSRNQVALMRAGILYPNTDFQGMALALATATGQATPRDGMPLNAREPHNALAFRMLSTHKRGRIPPFHENLPGLAQMKLAIKNQIEFLNPHTVVLASEVFSNFVRVGAPIIKDLLGIFPPDAEITIVATLRRIDEYLASWYGQQLKFGHKIAPLRENGIETYFDGIHFDYRRMLECWLDTAPQARFVIRDYAQVRASGGSVADFAAQTGLELPPGLEPERRANPSLHRGIYEIVRLGNHSLKPPEAQLLREALRRITPELALPPSHDIELFGAANRARMQDRFAPIQDYLATATGQVPFFESERAITELRPIPEMEVYAEVMAHLNRKLRRFGGFPNLRLLKKFTT